MKKDGGRLAVWICYEQQRGQNAGITTRCSWAGSSLILPEDDEQEARSLTLYGREHTHELVSRCSCNSFPASLFINPWFNEGTRFHKHGYPRLPKILQGLRYRQSHCKRRQWIRWLSLVDPSQTPVFFYLLLNFTFCIIHLNKMKDLLTLWMDGFLRMNGPITWSHSVASSGYLSYWSTRMEQCLLYERWNVSSACDMIVSKVQIINCSTSGEGQK